MSDNLKAERERIREALYRAAISCGHKIDAEEVVLYCDHRKPGNALAQLADRLADAALSLSSSRQVREEALMDLQYVAGFKAGWNAQLDGDEEAMARMLDRTTEALRALKSTPASPSQPSSVAMTDAQTELLGDFVELVFQCARYERPSTDWREAGKKFVADLLQSSPKGASTGTEPQDYETRHAIMEGERNAAVEAYIKARPQLDTIHNRRIYEKGFEKGFERGLDRASPQEVSKRDPKYIAHDREELEAVLDRIVASQPSAASGRELPTDVLTFIRLVSLIDGEPSEKYGDAIFKDRCFIYADRARRLLAGMGETP